MHVLSINSSGRHKGNTHTVLELYRNEFENRGIGTERLDLATLDIQICRGCRVCFDKGEKQCPLKDDVSQIARKILDADVLSAAGPIYVEDINGIMKNWIDRMAYNSHRPAFAAKSAYGKKSASMRPQSQKGFGGIPIRPSSR